MIIERRRKKNEKKNHEKCNWKKLLVHQEFTFYSFLGLFFIFKSDAEPFFFFFFVTWLTTWVKTILIADPNMTKRRFDCKRIIRKMPKNNIFIDRIKLNGHSILFSFGANKKKKNLKRLSQNGNFSYENEMKWKANVCLFFLWYFKTCHNLYRIFVL